MWREWAPLTKNTIFTNLLSHKSYFTDELNAYDDKMDQKFKLLQ